LGQLGLFLWRSAWSHSGEFDEELKVACRNRRMSCEGYCTKVKVSQPFNIGYGAEGLGVTGPASESSCSLTTEQLFLHSDKSANGAFNLVLLLETTISRWPCSSNFLSHRHSVTPHFPNSDGHPPVTHSLAAVGIMRAWNHGTEQSTGVPRYECMNPRVHKIVSNIHTLHYRAPIRLDSTTRAETSTTNWKCTNADT